VNPEAEALATRAYQTRRAGDSAASIALYREASQAFAASNEPLREAHTIRHAADLLRESGDLEESQTCYERAVALYETHAARSDLDFANALRGYALVQDLLGQDARPTWSHARELYVLANVEAGVAECDRRLRG
jgi:tetratricopeptide (TPR) repeat protein